LVQENLVSNTQRLNFGPIQDESKINFAKNLQKQLIFIAKQGKIKKIQIGLND
jgi:hypothetical protein